MSEQDRARLAALEAENAQLKTANAEAAAAIANAARTERHGAHVAFCEQLVTEGRLLPAHSAAIVAVLDQLASTPDVIEFGEGDAKQSQPAADALRAVLAAQPKQVVFGEVAGGADVVGDSDPSAIAAEASRIQSEAATRGESINSAQAVALARAGR